MKLAKRRITILVFVGYYLPGYKSGGPVRTIANVVEALGDEFEFRIVTSDRDLLDQVPYPGISADTWSQVGKAWVYYASPSKRGFFSWGHLIRKTPHDLLYLNSLFDPVYTLRSLLCRKLPDIPMKPVLVAPRGELSPGALGMKWWKKGSFLAIAKITSLYSNVQWHASTEDEARLIRQQFGGNAKVIVALDMAAMPGKPPATTHEGNFTGPLRIVFLSRISRMKNLGFALSVLSCCRMPVQFDIWGTLEDADYWKECQTIIRAMPMNVQARYRGAADHADVPQIISKYDLFFLPTLGENYGHVILEALTAGTPVLLSDATPWRNLESDGVGWDLPLDAGKDVFLKAIQEAAGKVAVERAIWRRHVNEYALIHLGDPALLEANRLVFLKALSRGEKCAID
jgi:glycosyltransferase involved in cell wall biosynthesis